MVQTDIFMEITWDRSPTSNLKAYPFIVNRKKTCTEFITVNSGNHSCQFFTVKKQCTSKIVSKKLTCTTFNVICSLIQNAIPLLLSNWDERKKKAFNILIHVKSKSLWFSPGLSRNWQWSRGTANKAETQVARSCYSPLFIPTPVTATNAVIIIVSEVLARWQEDNKHCSQLNLI